MSITELLTGILLSGGTGLLCGMVAGIVKDWR